MRCIRSHRQTSQAHYPPSPDQNFGAFQKQDTSHSSIISTNKTSFSSPSFQTSQDTLEPIKKIQRCVSTPSSIRCSSRSLLVSILVSSSILPSTPLIMNAHLTLSLQLASRIPRLRDGPRKWTSSAYRPVKFALGQDACIVRQWRRLGSARESVMTARTVSASVIRDLCVSCELMCWAKK